MMFTELLQAEVWRKKLEGAGYRVIAEAWEPTRRTDAVPRDHEGEPTERRDRTAPPSPPPFLPPP